MENLTYFETDSIADLGTAISQAMTRHNSEFVEKGEAWIYSFSEAIVYTARKARYRGRCSTPTIAYGDHKYTYIVRYEDGKYRVNLGDNYLHNA